jgi:hypothetical protein
MMSIQEYVDLIKFCTDKYNELGPGELSWYSDWLQAGRSGDRIPVEAKFFAHVQTGPGAHPASCTMGTGFFPEGKAAGARCWPPTF